MFQQKLVSLRRRVALQAAHAIRRSRGEKRVGPNLLPFAKPGPELVQSFLHQKCVVPHSGPFSNATNF
jgi:hypothetical protein